MSKKSDSKNEGFGIASIVIIVILAIGGLYYLYSSKVHEVTSIDENTNVPIETPAPVPDESANK